MDDNHGGGHDGPEFTPIVIDDKEYKAPKEKMTGAELRALANPPIGKDRDLFLTVPGPADDKKIGDTEVVELKPGMHFYSAPGTINPGDFKLPEADEGHLADKGYSWAVDQMGNLVIRGLPVSNQKYDKASVDLMVRIPGGYPMTALDMFYVSPELKLRNGGWPVGAEVFEQHGGRLWQRFSRHLQASPWRPGVDSIKTFLAVILPELQKA
jgi:hypothetical protein